MYFLSSSSSSAFFSTYCVQGASRRHGNEIVIKKIVVGNVNLDLTQQVSLKNAPEDHYDRFGTREI